MTTEMHNINVVLAMLVISIQSLLVYLIVGTAEQEWEKRKKNE